jgi:hypothetical protein
MVEPCQQMAFDIFALFLSCEMMQNFTQSLSRLPKYHFLPVFGNEHDVVLATPGRMV